MILRLSLLFLAVLLLGCSTDTGPGPSPEPSITVSDGRQMPSASEDTERFDHVITTDTEYYADGPQQARPPDGTLKAGTKVTVVEEAGSYSRVQTEDGVGGYVLVEAVKEIERED